jgi:hypothetical protein
MPGNDDKDDESDEESELDITDKLCLRNNCELDNKTLNDPEIQRIANRGSEATPDEKNT